MTVGLMLQCSSAIRGTSQTAKARIEAEAAWTALREQTGFPVHIFRLGGMQPNPISSQTSWRAEALP